MLQPSSPVEVEITHFHLFCGLGGGAIGFQRGHARVGNFVAKMKCVGGIDANPRAVVDFNRAVGVRATYMDLFDREQFIAWHGYEPAPGWQAAEPDSIRQAVIGGGTPDIVFLSPPCLPPDGLVVTPTGPVEIQTIRAGDLVLTHLGNFRQVNKVGTHLYEGSMYGFRLGGTVDVQHFTAEHPMYVRRVTREKRRNGGARRLGEPMFIPAEQVRVGDRIGYPIDHEVDGTAVKFVSKFGDPKDVPKTSKFGLEFESSNSRIVDLRTQANNLNLWFILGFYAGDGYRVTSKNEVNFCVGDEEGEKAALVREALTSLGLKWSTDRYGGSTNVKLRVSSKHLSQLCSEFGDGAENKHIPPELFGLETRFIESLLTGWRAADGSTSGRRERPPEQKGGRFHQAHWKIVSVSLQALRDLQRLLLRTSTFGGIHIAWPGGPQEIMGRVVQTLPRWELKVCLEPRKRTIYEFIDGCVWVRVRTVEKKDVTNERVWNLEVDEDNTFCAPMMATHNCKGASGLQTPERAKSSKYQALNRLTLRGIQLTLEAFADDPVPLIILENVPRIQNVGKELLDAIDLMLEAAGYAVAHTVHDAGELGGLAQHRKRFLLVARHRKKVPPFLWEAPKQPVRKVGEILSEMPLPDERVKMHRLPRLQWSTWMRLALVKAGGDWRSLQDLEIDEEGMVRGLRLVGAQMAPIEDPRTPLWTSERTGRVSAYGQYGVQHWDSTSGVVTGQAAPGSGPFSIADPRLTGNGAQRDGWHRYGNALKVTGWDDTAPTITSTKGGDQAIADPRLSCRSDDEDRRFNNVLRVTRWDEAAGTITGATGNARPNIADPRPAAWIGGRESFEGGGHYGVLSMDETAPTVTGHAKHDRGRWSVADTRIPLYDPKEQPKNPPIVIALDNTWHRPFTTLELAALQGFDWQSLFTGRGLAGDNDGDWRERIGNAVPPPAATAIASTMAETLLMVLAEQTTPIRSTPIWVTPLATALSLEPS